MSCEDSRWRLAETGEFTLACANILPRAYVGLVREFSLWFCSPSSLSSHARHQRRGIPSVLYWEERSGNCEVSILAQHVTSSADTVAAQRNPAGFGRREAIRQRMAAGVMHGVNYSRNTIVALSISTSTYVVPKIGVPSGLTLTSGDYLAIFRLHSSTPMY